MGGRVWVGLLRNDSNSFRSFGYLRNEGSKALKSAISLDIKALMEGHEGSHPLQRFSCNSGFAEFQICHILQRGVCPGAIGGGKPGRSIILGGVIGAVIGVGTLTAAGTTTGTFSDGIRVPSDSERT